MAQQTGQALFPNTPNFLGMLFNSAIHKTQFLTLIGGTEGGNALITTNPEYPISVEYAIGTPTQPAITEAGAVGAGTPTYFGLTQTTNVIQIFQEDITVSRFRQRATGALQGINTAGQMPERESEIALQLELHLQKMKQDMNYTAINGTFANGGLTDTAVANKTRGMLEAITTNAVTGVGKTDVQYIGLIDEMIKKVYDKGIFDTPVLFVNSTEKQKLSKHYVTNGLTEVDRNRFVAGVNVEQIVTDFGTDVFVVIDNDMPDKTLMLVDMKFVKPVFTRDTETGEVIAVHEHDQRGGMTYELYAEFGLDHGAEFNHGKVVYTLA